MRALITGLAALLAGCAITGKPETPADVSPQRKPFVTKLKPVEFRLPEELLPFYSGEMPLPSETFGYDTANRAESEEIVTIGPHGYSIKSGRLSLTHYENQPVRDRNDNIVVGWGCENILTIRNGPSTQKWVDTGCSGPVESYEEFDENGSLLAAEYPAGNSWAMYYDSNLDTLLVEEVESLWRARWNIPERPPMPEAD